MAGDFLSRVSLSKDGKRIATGSTRGRNSTGYVKIYDLVDIVWQQVGAVLTGQKPGDRFGSGLSLSKFALAVGSPIDSDVPMMVSLRVFEIPSL